MAQERSLRVSQSIKKEIASMLQRDIRDERISGLVSITEVEMTHDCRSARVYISVFGDDEAKKNTLEAMQDKVGMMRGEICRRLRLRFAPEMQIFLDDSLERGAKVSELLGKIARGEV